MSSIDSKINNPLLINICTLISDDIQIISTIENGIEFTFNIVIDLIGQSSLKYIHG